MDSIYTAITYETLVGARDRVLEDLNKLTGGHADRVILYVKEFNELDNILEKYKERGGTIA